MPFSFSIVTERSRTITPFRYHECGHTNRTIVVPFCHSELTHLFHWRRMHSVFAWCLYLMVIVRNRRSKWGPGYGENSKRGLVMIDSAPAEQRLFIWLTKQTGGNR